jgi:predicted neutral ceramidase superfamily lipid hydrolase
MEDLARTVAIIIFFPLIAAPITFLIVWRFPKKWVVISALPVSIISATLGLFLLLSQIGTVARAFGLWGLLFSLGTWRIMWRAHRDSKEAGNS